MKRASQATTIDPLPRQLSIAGLLGAATGILIQFLALPDDFPTVPPGPIILAAAAVFVTLGPRWWWSPLVGSGLTLMIAVGGVLNGGVADNLSDSAGPAIGAAVMLVGFVTAIGAGIVALWRCGRGGLAQPTFGQT